MFIPMLVDISRKCEDTSDSGCFGPSNWADNSITWPEEPKAAGGIAKNILAYKLSPLPENPGKKAFGLLFWEFKLLLYVKHDAEDALLQIPWTQARRVMGAVRLDRQLVTNFIQPYLYQFFDDSYSLNGYGKPLKRPFDRYQSCLKAISIGRDIRQINW